MVERPHFELLHKWLHVNNYVMALSGTEHQPAVQFSLPLNVEQHMDYFHVFQLHGASGETIPEVQVMDVEVLQEETSTATGNIKHTYLRLILAVHRIFSFRYYCVVPYIIPTLRGNNTQHRCSKMYFSSLLIYNAFVNV